MEQELNFFFDFVANLLQNKNYSLEVTSGRRYHKLIMVRGNNRSVWAFVNLETGDIFKAASWTAPAKHARGNINNPMTYEHYTWLGPPYL